MSLPLYSQLRELQQDVIDCSQILYKEFNILVGHPSQRIPGTDRFIIMGHLHPLGQGMNGVKSLEQLVVLDLNLRKISGEWEKMNEAVVHASIYKARPEVNGVAYVHPFYSDLFGAMNRSIPTYRENIPIWDSHGAIADSERAAGLIKAMGTSNAILTRNPHSLITAADSVKNATVMATRIESRAKIDYNSLLVNHEAYLNSLGPALDPKYPPKNFSYHVDEFDMDVLHNDVWAQLYQKYIVEGAGPKRTDERVGSSL